MKKKARLRAQLFVAHAVKTRQPRERDDSYSRSVAIVSRHPRKTSPEVLAHPSASTPKLGLDLVVIYGTPLENFQDVTWTWDDERSQILRLKLRAMCVGGAVLGLGLRLQWKVAPAVLRAAVCAPADYNPRHSLDPSLPSETHCSRFFSSYGGFFGGVLAPRVGSDPSSP